MGQIQGKNGYVCHLVPITWITHEMLQMAAKAGVNSVSTSHTYKPKKYMNIVVSCLAAFNVKRVLL